MKGIVRKGDKTSSGGVVMAGSERMRIAGIGVAHLNDPVSCPLEGHNPSFIAEGHPTLRDEGRPIALHGYRCTCGCTLIASLGHVGASE